MSKYGITITEVRMRRLKNEESMIKATASITINDAIVIHGLRVVQKADGHTFVAMPSRLIGNPEKRNFVDVAHPINQETMTLIEERMLNEYQILVDKDVYSTRDLLDESEEKKED